LATVAYLLCTTTTPLEVLPGRMDEGMSSLILLAVPLFVMLGALIEMTEMAKAMVEFLAALVGHVRGGLQYVLLARCCWCPASQGRRRPTWPPSLLCCFPR